MPKHPDHYAELGLQPDATPDDIRAAYRSLAKKYHPDLHHGDPKATERFQRIGEAFRVLHDPERRLAYHQAAGLRGAAAPRKRPPKPGAAGPTAPRKRDGAAGSERFADMFKKAFQSGFGFSIKDSTGAPKEGEDLTTTLRLNPLQMARGGEYVVHVKRAQPCRSCGGKGVKRGGAENECPHCLGLGEVPASRGGKTVFVTCPDCDGTGSITLSRCEACNGRGRLAAPAKVRVRVPMNAAAGQELRISKQGHAGGAQGREGDLIVRLEEAPDPRVRREGERMHLTVDVNLLQALGGEELEVDTPAGVQHVRLSSKVLRGQPVTVPGVGLPRANGKRGDVVISARIRIAETLDSRAETLLRQLVNLPGWRTEPRD